MYVYGFMLFCNKVDFCLVFFDKENCIRFLFECISIIELGVVDSIVYDFKGWLIVYFDYVDNWLLCCDFFVICN